MCCSDDHGNVQHEAAEPVAQVPIDHDVYPPLAPELVDVIAGAEPVVV